MTGLDTDFAGFDPGTTSGIDAPEAASSSADASTGFDFSGNSFFSGSDYPSSDALYDAGIYDAIAGLTAPAAPVGMSPAVRDVLRDYQDRFGGSGDLAGLGVTFNTPIDIGNAPSPVAGGAAPEQPAGFLDRYSASAYDPPPANAPNVVGTPGSGGYLVDRLGNPVTSKSYGLPGEYTPESPQLPAGTLNLVDEMQRAGLLPMGPSTPSMTSATGLGYDTLEALQNAGLGSLEISPTQTVDQALASKTTQDFLEKYAPTIFGAATGFGPHLNAIRMGADVLSGKTTPGQALTGIGLELAASKLGLPGGGRVLGDVLDGRMDRAASGLTQAGLAAALGRAAGIPAPLAGIALQETGLGPKAGAAVGNAIGPSQPTGATSSIAQFFDKGLGGLKGIFSGVPQGDAGTAPMSQTAGVPTYAYAGDSSPDSSATVAAPASSATTATSTAPEVQAARRLLYGLAQGPYGPLLAYDIGERA